MLTVTPRKLVPLEAPPAEAFTRTEPHTAFVGVIEIEMLLAFTYLFHAAPWAIIVGFVLAFVIGSTFYYTVEKRSHSFSRRFAKSKPTSPTAS